MEGGGEVGEVTVDPQLEEELQLLVGVLEIWPPRYKKIKFGCV